MSKAQMDAAPLLVSADTTPTNPNDLFAGDIITFGTCKTEWVILARDFAYFDVECIKHPDSTNLGQRQHIRHASTAVWWLGQDSPVSDGYGADACDAPRVGE